MSGTYRITVTVNGTRHDCEVEGRVHLADFLRENLRLTGTHVGCEHGVCGACTILVNGDAVRSCLMLAVQADGQEIVTIEGIASGDQLSPLQEALRKHHGLQCGFCTPGVLATLSYFLKDNPRPSRDEVREALTANLCRCTGYKGMIDAVMAITGGGDEG
jgi:carbon-monoxide dehydrogenase small subunit